MSINGTRKIAPALNIDTCVDNWVSAEIYLFVNIFF